MSFKFKFRRILIAYSVRTPAMILVFAGIVFLMIYLAFVNSFINLYILSSGTIGFSKTVPGSLYIQANINRNYQNIVGINSLVSWYVKPEGRRYSAEIVECQRLRNSIQLKIRPCQDDIRSEFGVIPSHPGEASSIPIKVEIYYRRIQIIQKILRGT